MRLWACGVRLTMCIAISLRNSERPGEMFDVRYSTDFDGDVDRLIVRHQTI
jgi:hypothetical protein